MLECPTKYVLEKLLAKREEKGGNQAYLDLNNNIKSLFETINSTNTQTRTRRTSVQNVDTTILPRKMFYKGIDINEDIMEVTMKRLRFEQQVLEET